MERQAARVARDPLVGSVLHERYRVIRRIGRGGMGIVYLAEHVLIGRKYAVKILSERANATDEMVARFHREAVAAAAVGSEHVVEVTDMGRLDDGTTFLVMEYLQGVDLADAVSASGPFAPERAVKITCQLCDALTAVHETGIVHRDLKPENLFLIAHEGSTDFLKVLDFGVCKLLDGAPDLADPDQPPLTRTNASLGTPQYMAPEQFQNSAGVDHRADIHAVGAILYFMLTGRPPFDAPTLGQLFMRICVEPPPPLLALRPELPPALDAVLRRALGKHPDDRYESAAALKAALLPFADLRPGDVPAGITLPAAISNPTLASTRDDRPKTGSRIVGARPSWLPPRSRWLRPLLAAALVLGVVTVMAWGTAGNEAARGPTPRAGRENGSGKPRETPRESLTLEPPAATAATTEPESPLPAAAPQSPKPRPRIKLAAAAAHGTTENEPPAPAAQDSQTPEPAAAPAPAGARTVSTETEASYRFPRRALKDVF
jgi:serine/threonine protein kinase